MDLTLHEKELIEQAKHYPQLNHTKTICYYVCLPLCVIATALAFWVTVKQGVMWDTAAFLGLCAALTALIAAVIGNRVRKQRYHNIINYLISATR